MMNEVRLRALDTVKRTVFDRLAGHPARVYLFGSRARGDAGQRSGIDVAIEPPEPRQPGLIALIDEDLEESTVPYFVDVVDLSTAGSKLRDAVKRESVEWHPPKAPEDPRPVSRA
ncbi:nucleotidyltransferase family protein [Azospirillum thermophilum]|uniref:Nucleotidyltransferase domain-containing protein n=1 Tax=Azospirillum thermophilum TaxID=2202148 RepID=A0A2S2CKV4_9PROT|nr:nucleotidyltransferase domain-containing protein [Azospirillum thermophilum]AWK85148.1 nucleotidyltransferase domain-containing protein [Azospirillum thermophilum]